LGNLHWINSTMIGFVTSPTTSYEVLQGIEEAQLSRGLPFFWTTGSYPIYAGANTGQVFIPADDELLTTNLRQGLTPMDFPETHIFIKALGGLDARVEIDPKDIVNPNPAN